MRKIKWNKNEKQMARWVVESTIKLYNYLKTLYITDIYHIILEYMTIITICFRMNNYIKSVSEPFKTTSIKHSDDILWTN